MSGQNHAFRRLATSIRRRLNRWTAVNGFVLRRRQGLALLLNPANYVDRRLDFDGWFEPAQTDFFFAEMGGRGCDVFLDVGANIGLYSVIAASRSLAPRVIAFEPDARNRLQFGANLLLNGVHDRVEIRAEAVSDGDGVRRFAPAPASSTGQSHIVTEGGLEVRAVTLDAAVPVADRRIFIKMDIEGHEPAALAGMKTLAARNRIFLQVEAFGERADEIAALLAPMGLVFVRRIDSDSYFASEGWSS